MALVELMKRGHIHSIVSQNIDGLHRKSGIHADGLVELHGNTNLELCTKCGREHMRDFKVRAATNSKKHLTGRICDTPGCGGALKDTIINFGENLNSGILNKGFDEHRKADLVIACGSSLRVSPASEMPVQAVQNGANFVNINLQKTPLDYLCAMNVFGMMDDVFELLMEKLGYQMPEFRLERRLKVSLSDDKKNVNFTGLDMNGACFSLFKKITVGGLANTEAILPSAKENV